jgi:hypothetical protein
MVGGSRIQSTCGAEGFVRAIITGSDWDVSWCCVLAAAYGSLSWVQGRGHGAETLTLLCRGSSGT